MELAKLSDVRGRPSLRSRPARGPATPAYSPEAGEGAEGKARGSLLVSLFDRVLLDDPLLNVALGFPNLFHIPCRQFVGVGVATAPKLLALHRFPLRPGRSILYG
jgi:hypothetical protein